MTFWNRILLTYHYGRGVFLIGAVYNLMCVGLLFVGFSYSFMVNSFIIKGLITAITLFLLKKFRNRDDIFFYINLGLSYRLLLTSIILADFLSLATLITIILLVYG